MSDEFSMLVELEFAPANIELAEKLGRDAQTRAGSETGTLEYTWYVDAEAGCVHIHERYATSESFLAHVAAHALHQAKYEEVFTTSRIWLYGNAPEQLVEFFSDLGVSPKVFRRVAANDQAGQE